MQLPFCKSRISLLFYFSLFIILFDFFTVSNGVGNEKKGAGKEKSKRNKSYNADKAMGIDQQSNMTNYSQDSFSDIAPGDNIARGHGQMSQYASGETPAAKGLYPPVDAYPPLYPVGHQAPYGLNGNVSGRNGIVSSLLHNLLNLAGILSV